MVRVLVADDEKGIRLVLRRAVEKIDGFEVAGEAEDGQEAVSLFDSLQPQVVLLDVEMPGLSGLECAKTIVDINPRAIIIFVTGHQEFMPEAFEMYAFDYIVKPFKIERIFKTLERIKLLNFGDDRIQIPERPKSGELNRLIVKGKEGISFIDMKSIIFVERQDRSSIIYTDEGSFTTSEGLSELEERLDKGCFLRSHKSYIINLSRLSKIYPYGRWTYVVKLRGTEKDALLTHEKYEEVKRIFGE